jgi:hypothetical protein
LHKNSRIKANNDLISASLGATGLGPEGSGGSFKHALSGVRVQRVQKVQRVQRVVVAADAAK